MVIAAVSGFYGGLLSDANDMFVAAVYFLLEKTQVLTFAAAIHRRK
jgi:hypothetical protein